MTKTGTSPKVSIIIPTWNRAEYIMESVQSVMDQTYQNWELIIVDDGSDDNTEEIILQIKDTRVQFCKAGKTGLGIKLKNRGMERSGGELIAFLDSDDIWAPDKLEKQVKALNDHPDAGFSITGGYNFKRPGQPVNYFYKERKGLKYGDIFFSFFRSEAYAVPSALMFRRDCIPVIHEYVMTDPDSDVAFILGLALNFKAVILYEPLLYRRLHEESTTSMNWERGYREGIVLINLHKNKKNLPARVAKESLFRLYLHSGEKYLQRRQKLRAIKCFLNAWKNKPFSIIPIKKAGKAILY
ncbi:MAG TPA: glycosyltransferase family A protein [Ferruginibacter sp.]|nr:glycosyltransferase family A protein [Ferruginibacter sp.]